MPVRFSHCISSILKCHFISFSFLICEKLRSLSIYESSSYKNSWIRVERNREQQTIDLQLGIPFETVKLTAFGRNKVLYYNILEEGLPFAMFKYIHCVTQCVFLY